MDLIENLGLEKTGRSRQESFSVSSEIKTISTDLSAPFSRKFEYSLTGKVRCNFWSSQEGTEWFEMQKREAERTIIHILYRDILSLISPLRNEIMSGNTVEALELCKEIEQELRVF